MKRISAAFIIILILIFLPAASDDPIPNFYQPRHMIFTAGQPTAAGFQQVAAIGIQTVINVLPEEQCIREEEGIVRANRMDYYKLPFDPSGINSETIRKFGELLDCVQRPVLIHCSTGNHVGGLWFAYRVSVENASLPLALMEARRIGMKPTMEFAVYEWLFDHGIRASR